ncbi:hypothetical protein CEK25_001369 [Fusarium fujikuroi]|nr:hypothetical protein CEK25_001369 [Fusarium fujikuroi]
MNALSCQAHQVQKKHSPGGLTTSRGTISLLPRPPGGLTTNNGTLSLLPLAYSSWLLPRITLAVLSTGVMQAIAFFTTEKLAVLVEIAMQAIRSDAKAETNQIVPWLNTAKTLIDMLNILENPAQECDFACDWRQGSICKNFGESSIYEWGLASEEWVSTQAMQMALMRVL